MAETDRRVIFERFNMNVSAQFVSLTLASMAILFAICNLVAPGMGPILIVGPVIAFIVAVFIAFAAIRKEMIYADLTEQRLHCVDKGLFKNHHRAYPFSHITKVIIHKREVKIYSPHSSHNETRWAVDIVLEPPEERDDTGRRLKKTVQIFDQFKAMMKTMRGSGAAHAKKITLAISELTACEISGMLPDEPPGFMPAWLVKAVPNKTARIALAALAALVFLGVLTLACILIFNR